jgi:hypothetical protein
MLDQASVPCLCRDHKPSFIDRPLLSLPLIAIWFVSLVLLFPLARLQFGVQLGPLVPYTAFMVLGTFTAQRQEQPYFFECPFVRRTLPRLVRRHIAFLAALVIAETILPEFTQVLPSSWRFLTTTQDGTFAVAPMILAGCLALVQMFTNRSLLERAHRATSSPSNLALPT